MINTKTIADNALTLKTEKLNAMNYTLLKINNEATRMIVYFRL
jgi:hypothetical protein